MEVAHLNFWVNPYLFILGQSIDCSDAPCKKCLYSYWLSMKKNVESDVTKII